MDAVIKISSSEFNEELFEKIKLLLKGRKANITIAVQDENDDSLVSEPAEEYWNRLHKSVEDIQAGKGVTFSMKELEAFVKE